MVETSIPILVQLGVMTDDPIAALRSDPELRPLIEENGAVTIEPAEDPFERLVVSIVNQQLSSASAAAIRERAEITGIGAWTAKMDPR